MNKISRIFWTAQALGWENLPRRVLQIAKTKLRILEMRLPGGELSANELRNQFVPSYDVANVRGLWAKRAAAFGLEDVDRTKQRAALLNILSCDDRAANLQRDADRIASGELPFFNHRWEHVGSPPNFHYNPIHDVTWPTGKHWTTYGQFNPELKDLKCVWEASRFSWAYLLARAHVANPDGNAAETFWRYFEAWDEQNPYGLTAQWACGQESSFRLFAWLFAATVILDAPATTDKRLARLSELVWYTGRHVSENIVYARSQKNNHAISEAVALWLIGSLFPELKAASDWRTQGTKVLEAEVARQIYGDGSYVQHSLNYHRVMLDDLLLALSVARRIGDSFSSRLHGKFVAATHWLLDFVDPDTGVVANYGANDGALVLPLSTCDYTDYRPVARAACWFADIASSFEAGPWDEKLFWLADGGSLAGEKLGGSLGLPEEKASLEAVRESVGRREGGYLHLRGRDSHAMIRCHSYVDRPSQADMLHLDLTYRGVNVLRDGGSYYYFTEQPWHDWFYSTAAHNTVEVDQHDQMIKGPRFLWLRWTRAEVRKWLTRPDLDIDYFRGVHFGYARLAGRVVHERTVFRRRDVFVVFDEITGRGSHEAALRWRLCDADWQRENDECRAEIGGDEFALRVGAADGSEISLRRGEEGPQPEGWESRYYAVKTAVPTVVARTARELPIRFVSAFGPAAQLADFEIDSVAMNCHVCGLGVAAGRFLERVGDVRIVAT